MRLNQDVKQTQVHAPANKINNIMTKDELTVEQLEELLKQKKSEQRDIENRQRQAYVAQRDAIVRELVDCAEKMHKELSHFKAKAKSRLEDFRDAASKYGDIRGNSKGGFGLRTEDGKLKVVLERNIKTEYDERADMAEQLLREFLDDTIRKKDQKMHKMITSLMTRNKKSGDYNPVSINSLLSMADEYDDERWVKSMKLFRESFRVTEVSMSVSFYRKDEDGKDQIIPLSFPSL